MSKREEKSLIAEVDHDMCEGCMRRQDDWKRIDRLEFVQEMHEKEIAELGKTSQCLIEGMRDINNTLKRIFHISVGVGIAFAVQLLGLEKVITSFIGL